MSPERSVSPARPAVVLNWIADDSMTDLDTGADRGGHEVIERSLIALDCLTHALSAGNDALRRKELTKDSYVKLLSLVNETIHHLTAGKNMLNTYAPK
ncbi:MAG: hypothetical protein IID28_08350 [Planctomycetes bacterium]|nr:hypothetical protein [Planctomycetota bacterium]